VWIRKRVAALRSKENSGVPARDGRPRLARGGWVARAALSSCRFRLGADAVRDRVQAYVLVQRVLVLVNRRLEVENDLVPRARERVRPVVLVGEVDHKAVVTADVHARIRRARDGRGLLQPTLADLLAVRQSITLPPAPGLGFFGLERHLHDDVTDWDRLGGALLVALHAEERIGVIEENSRCARPCSFTQSRKC